MEQFLTLIQPVLDVLSWILILLGSAGVLIGSFGLVRLPDFYTRMHAAGITDTAGLELMTLGLLLQAGFTNTAVKLILIGVFIFFTSPTSTHAIANAAWTMGLKPWGVKDDDSQAGKAGD
ncbi:MAG: monovalent cation/H(+) antiporter subunit G [Rhodospirillaceae bacterium]|nr:monovalent cation/H(+) antiporter subunit G [Rhodospirillaceae bacterium]MBT6137533.1 monovalent cation/H(+) antiporter subunit G [Rhodospirillaceae bacterium]